MFWNESSEFPLFLMEKFALMYESFGLQSLCSQTKVPLYFLESTRYYMVEHNTFLYITCTRPLSVQADHTQCYGAHATMGASVRHIFSA
jgi:hypothetical protein